MRERSRGTWLGRFIALAGLAVVAYYTTHLLRARADTPRIVREALSSDRLVLGPDDPSPAQVEALLAVQDPHFFTHAGWDFAHGTMTTITQSLVKGLNVHAQPEANRRRVLQIKRLLAGECRRPGLLGTAPHCWTEDPT